MTRAHHQTREQAMQRTSIVGAVVNLALTLLKVGVGIVGHSAALVADGIHSLADLATDLMVWLAARYSNQPPDKDHPYGHGRIETAFTVVLGTVLMLTALGILIDAGQRLLDPARLLEPTPLVLVIAAVSIIANEALYRYTMRVAVQHRSTLLEVNAWHHRTDAVSSIVVLVGVAGSMAGFPYLDAFAAAGVALMVGRIGWGQARTATLELVDTGLEPEHLRAIRELITDVDGVRDLLVLRTRKMAGRTLIDVHILVQPTLSVSEGHRIGAVVRDRLLASSHNVAYVTVHTDPEDAEGARKTGVLPLRCEVLAGLRESWTGVVPEAAYTHITLHYLDGRIGVDLTLDWTSDRDIDPQTEAARLQRAAEHLEWLGAVRVFLA